MSSGRCLLPTSTYRRSQLTIHDRAEAGKQDFDGWVRLRFFRPSSACRSNCRLAPHAVVKVPHEVRREIRQGRTLSRASVGIEQSERSAHLKLCHQFLPTTWNPATTSKASSKPSFPISTNIGLSDLLAGYADNQFRRYPRPVPFTQGCEVADCVKRYLCAERMKLLEVSKRLFDLHIACEQTLEFDRHIFCNDGRIHCVRANWLQVLHKDNLKTRLGQLI